MITLDTRLTVYPFSRQVNGQEVVIGTEDRQSFLAVPPEAVEILDWLAAGKSMGETQQLYNDKYGEVPDLEDFLTLLQSKRFVGILDAHPGVARRAPQARAETSKTIRYHFANIPQAFAQKVFGPTSLAIAAALFALSLVALFLEPSLLPAPAALYFPEHSSLKTLILMVLGYASTFVHELGHLVAARAVGVNSRLGIGRRLWILVAETDLTGLWAVEKHLRYLPILAGPITDLVSASLLILALFCASRSWISPPAVSIEIVKALVFVYLLRLLWQFFFFLRTDFYYLISTYFDCKNLMRDTRDFLSNWLSRWFPARKVRDQSNIPREEMRVIRAYSVVWLLGRLAAYYSLAFLTLPVAIMYFRAAFRIFFSDHQVGLYEILDGVLIVVFFLLPITIGLGLWLGSFFRKGRQARHERAQSINYA